MGTVAELEHVNEQTISHYERRGLLWEPDRTVSNYRVGTASFPTKP